LPRPTHSGTALPDTHVVSCIPVQKEKVPILRGKHARFGCTSITSSASLAPRKPAIILHQSHPLPHPQSRRYFAAQPPSICCRSAAPLRRAAIEAGPNSREMLSVGSLPHHHCILIPLHLFRLVRFCTIPLTCTHSYNHQNRANLRISAATSCGGPLDHHLSAALPLLPPQCNRSPPYVKSTNPSR
jgi:hypothetical protein